MRMTEVRIMLRSTNGSRCLTIWGINDCMFVKPYAANYDISKQCQISLQQRIIHARCCAHKQALHRTYEQSVCTSQEMRLLYGGWINAEISSYQYRKSHCGDKTILRPSNLHNGISYTDKMRYLYWIRAMVVVHYVVSSVYKDMQNLFDNDNHIRHRELSTKATFPLHNIR